MYRKNIPLKDADECFGNTKFTLMKKIRKEWLFYSNKKVNEISDLKYPKSKIL